MLLLLLLLLSVVVAKAGLVQGDRTGPSHPILAAVAAAAVVAVAHCLRLLGVAKCSSASPNGEHQYTYFEKLLSMRTALWKAQLMYVPVVKPPGQKRWHGSGLFFLLPPMERLGWTVSVSRLGDILDPQYSNIKDMPMFWGSFSV